MGEFALPKDVPGLDLNFVTHVYVLMLLGVSDGHLNQDFPYYGSVSHGEREFAVAATFDGHGLLVSIYVYRSAIMLSVLCVAYTEPQRPSFAIWNTPYFRVRVAS